MDDARKLTAAPAGQQTVERRRCTARRRKRGRAGSRAGAAPGLEFPRYFTTAGVDPFDEVEWELRDAVIGNEKGTGRLRAARRRDPEAVVAAGDQHRRLEVFPRPDRRAGARALGQAADRPRRRHDHRLGAQAELLRDRGRAAGVQRRAEAPARLAEGARSTARSGSTAASRRRRSARPASSTRWTTRWTRS